jgi:hypothetical protein
MKSPRLAYLVLAHKNPEQVNAFVRCGSETCPRKSGPFLT